MVKLKNDNGIKILCDTGNRAYNDRADNEMARITKRLCLLGFVLFGFFFVPLVFTHIESSPLPVKSCKF